MSNDTTLSTSDNILILPNTATTTTISSTPFWTSNYGTFNISVDSSLFDMNYDIFFSKDKDRLLKDNITSINNKKLTFNCNFINNERIQPYEKIMQMIDDKVKFTITIDVSDILKITYVDTQFKSIQNNLSFKDGLCQFSELIVKIKSKKVIYTNHKLPITEKRKDKLKKIMEI
jgi:hypothetical protein